MTMDLIIYHGQFDIGSEKKFLEKIRELTKSQPLYIVFFDRSVIAGCEHIRKAVSLAERSFFYSGDPISNFFEMEILLYAFGTRQTGLASGFGIRSGNNDSIICICRQRPAGEEKEKFEEKTEAVVRNICNLDEFTEGTLSEICNKKSRNFFSELSKNEICKIMNIFDITQEEIDVCGRDKLEELIIERCALLDVNK